MNIALDKTAKINFVVDFLGLDNEILYGNTPACNVSQTDLLLQGENSRALSAMDI